MVSVPCGLSCYPHQRLSPKERKAQREQPTAKQSKRKHAACAASDRVRMSFGHLTAWPDSHFHDLMRHMRRTVSDSKPFAPRNHPYADHLFVETYRRPRSSSPERSPYPRNPTHQRKRRYRLTARRRLTQVAQRLGHKSVPPYPAISGPQKASSRRQQADL